jgi:hypothetical protein
MTLVWGVVLLLAMKMQWSHALRTRQSRILVAQPTSSLFHVLNQVMINPIKPNIINWMAGWT